VQPGEPSIWVLLRIHRHMNVRCAKLLRRRIKMPYAEVNHPPLFCSAEVIGVLCKRRKNSGACLLVPGFLIIALRRQLDSKMILVSLSQHLRILRTEKDSSNASNTLH